jgi:hypothetical protein
VAAGFAVHVDSNVVHRMGQLTIVVNLYGGAESAAAVTPRNHTQAGTTDPGPLIILGLASSKFLVFPLLMLQYWQHCLRQTTVLLMALVKTANLLTRAPQNTHPHVSIRHPRPWPFLLHTDCAAC